MWFVLGVLTGLAGWAWHLAMSTHMRERAEKYPDSLMATYLKAFDKLEEATLFRSIRARGTNEGREIPPNGTAEATRRLSGQDGPFTVGNAIFVGIDLESSVPARIWKLWSPAAQFGILVTSVMVIVLIAGLLAGDSIPFLFLILGGLLLAVVGSLVLTTAMVWERGLAGSLSHLRMNPRLSLFITKGKVFSYSAWGRIIFHGDQVVFSSAEGPLVTELRISAGGDAKDLTVFSYPNHFRKFLTGDVANIPDLCAKLNRVVGQTHVWPENSSQLAVEIATSGVGLTSFLPASEPSLSK
jgi:hypothetical protein